MIYQAAKLV